MFSPCCFFDWHWLRSTNWCQYFRSGSAQTFTAHERILLLVLSCSELVGMGSNWIHRNRCFSPGAPPSSSGSLDWLFSSFSLVFSPSLCLFLCHPSPVVPVKVAPPTERAPSRLLRVNMSVCVSSLWCYGELCRFVNVTYQSADLYCNTEGVHLWSCCQVRRLPVCLQPVSPHENIWRTSVWFPLAPCPPV